MKKTVDRFEDGSLSLATRLLSKIKEGYDPSNREIGFVINALVTDLVNLSDEHDELKRHYKVLKEEKEL